MAGIKLEKRTVEVFVVEYNDGSTMEFKSADEAAAKFAKLKLYEAGVVDQFDNMSINAHMLADLVDACHKILEAYYALRDDQSPLAELRARARASTTGGPRA